MSLNSTDLNYIITYHTDNLIRDKLDDKKKNTKTPPKSRSPNKMVAYIGTKISGHMNLHFPYFTDVRRAYFLLFTCNSRRVRRVGGGGGWG